MNHAEEKPYSASWKGRFVRAWCRVEESGEKEGRWESLRDSAGENLIWRCRPVPEDVQLHVVDSKRVLLRVRQDTNSEKFFCWTRSAMVLRARSAWRWAGLLPLPWLSCFFCPLSGIHAPWTASRRRRGSVRRPQELAGILAERPTGVGRLHPPAQHGFLICRRARDAARITATRLACRFMLLPSSCSASGLCESQPSKLQIRASPKKSAKAFLTSHIFFCILSFRSRYPHSACSWLNPLSLAVCPAPPTPPAIIVRHTYQQSETAGVAAYCPNRPCCTLYIQINLLCAVANYVCGSIPPFLLAARASVSDAAARKPDPLRRSSG